MRTSIWIAGMGLASLGAVGLFSVQFATPAVPAPKAETKAAVDDRDELAKKLMERVTLKDPYKNVALKDVLDALSEKHDITFIVDQKSFNSNVGNAALKANEAVALNAQDDAGFNPLISVPAMKNVHVATIVKYVADQIDGVYLIYPDHIEIVGLARAFTLMKLPTKAYLPVGEQQEQQLVPSDTTIRWSINLLTASFTEKPLQEALKEIELRTNSTIVLAPQAGENGRAFVTARFANVPVETAVATLAELAGLKMARKGNVLLVTTAERADEFAPNAPAEAAPAAPMLGGIAPMLGGIAPMPAPADPSIEALKMKVAELEKAIAEMKQKK